LNLIQDRIEVEQITKYLIVEENDAFQNYQKALGAEEDKWCLKSIIL
jgi:hypothetical protein